MSRSSQGPRPLPTLGEPSWTVTYGRPKDRTSSRTWSPGVACRHVSYPPAGVRGQELGGRVPLPAEQPVREPLPQLDAGLVQRVDAVQRTRVDGRDLKQH